MLVTELLLLLITARWLTLSDRGHYATAISLIKGLTLLSFCSLGQIALYRFAEFKGVASKAEIARVVGNLLLAVAVLPAVALLLFALVSMGFPRIRETYFMPFGLVTALALPFFVAEQYLNSLLLALGRLNSANVWTVGGKTITWLAALVSVCFTSFGADGIVASVIFGQVVLVLGDLAVAHRELRRQDIRPALDIADFVRMLLAGSKLHPTALGGIVFGSADVLLVFNYGGPKDAAIYQLALQMVTAMTVLPYAVGQVGFAQIAQWGPSQSWRQYRSTLFWSGLLMLAAAAALGVTASAWLPLVLGNEYHAAVPVFQVMLWGFPGMIFSIGMAPQWIGRGHFAVASVLTLLTAVFSAAANLYAISHHGIMGAAWVFAAAGLLSMVGNGVFIYLITRETS